MSAKVMGYDDRFMRHVGVSLALHITVVLVFTLKIFLFPDDLNLEQPALKVNLVALPDKIQELPPLSKAELPQPAAPTVPKKAEHKKAEPVEKAVVLNPKKENKKKEQAALNKLKQMSAIENLEKEAKAAAKPQTFKGNQLANGDSPRGLDRLQHDSYVTDVTNHIHNYWAIPTWLAHKKLRTKVRVRLDEKGNIVGKEILQSSGNPTFDEAALTTLEKASPMPKPPERIQRVIAYQGIVVGFPE